MDKKYQVFISSTFTDLKEERWQALKALMNIDCIVSGMELFPAIDQDQFEYIKNTIDSCDYYLLIIGGRYGSVATDGLSFTEKEYDYAVQRGIKVIALLHECPEELDESKRDNDPILIEKLDKFKDKVKTGRIVDFWKDLSEIQGKVIVGLMHAIKNFPAIGWVRGNVVANETILTEINTVRKEKEELQEKNRNLLLQLKPSVDEIADFDDSVNIDYKLYWYDRCVKKSIKKEKDISWREIFWLISPYLQKHVHIDEVKTKLELELRRQFNHSDSTSVSIERTLFHTIILQNQTLGLISCDELQTVNGGSALFCKLTAKGKKVMIEVRTIKKADSNCQLG